MSKKAQLKGEVEKQIRALLLSTPKGLTVRDVQVDYIALLGSVLPYRELGYASAEDLFRDMPGVVQLSWIHGQAILRGISDASTRHIARMVACQKDNKSRSRGLKKPPMRKETGSWFQPNTRPIAGPNSNTRPIARPRPNTRQIAPRFFPQNQGKTQNQNQPPDPEPTIPAAMRGQIRSLLMSYANGLQGSQFDTAFARRFGHHLDCCKLGFRNHFQLLKTLSDITIDQLPDGSYMLHGRPVSKRHESTGTSCGQTEPIANASRPQASSLSAQGSGPGKVFIDDDSGISDQLKKQIQMVLASKPEGIPAAQFPTQFMMALGIELPMKQLGYLSVIEFMSAMADIVTIERPTASDWLLFDARIQRNTAKPVSESFVKKSSDAQKMSSEPNIDIIFKETVRQVVEAYPDGVYLDQLRDKYRELTDQELHIEQHGFASIGFLVRALTDTLSVEHTTIGKVLIHALPNRSQYKQDLLKRRPGDAMVSTQPGVSRMMTSCYGNVPSDAVGPGNYYTPQAVPGNLSYVKVLVSNIVSPGNFWLQLKGQSTTTTLEYLMDAIEETYDSGDDYTMPESLVAVGQVCAAIFPEDSNWHRVSITGIRDLDFVEVYYVDYGSTSCVSKKSLRLLKYIHFKLPAQALRARLANIQPANGTSWTKAARDHMLSLTADRTVLALVTNLAIQDRTVSVCLVDTRSREDIHINDTLVQKGHAYFEKDDYYDGQTAAEPTPEPPLIESEESVPVECSGQEESDQNDHSPTASSRCVKFVQLTKDYCFHLVKVDEKPYVVCAEVSALLWNNDILKPMLKQKKKQIPWLVLSEDDSHDVFDQFAAFGVPGTMDGKEMKAYVLLYELSNVAQILQLFAHPCPDLKSAVQQQIDEFSADDAYWTTGVESKREEEEQEEEEEEEEDEEEDEEGDSSVKGLELALQTLQFKRQRIISAMMAADSSSQHGYVEQLNHAEVQLICVRERLLTAQQAAADGESSTTKLSAGDMFIQKCIDEQYKSHRSVNATRQTSPARRSEVKPVGTPSPMKKTNPVAPMPAPAPAPRVVPRPVPVAAPVAAASFDAPAFSNEMLRKLLAGADITQEISAHLEKMKMDNGLLTGASTTVLLSGLTGGASEPPAGGVANAAMMGGPNAELLGGANAALMGGANVAPLMGGANAALMGGVNAAMMGGQTTSLMGGANVSLLSGTNAAALGQVKSYLLGARRPSPPTADAPLTTDQQRLLAQYERTLSQNAPQGFPAFLPAASSDLFYNPPVGKSAFMQPLTYNPLSSAGVTAAFPPPAFPLPAAGPKHVVGQGRGGAAVRQLPCSMTTAPHAVGQGRGAGTRPGQPSALIGQGRSTALQGCLQRQP